MSGVCFEETIQPFNEMTPSKEHSLPDREQKNKHLTPTATKSDLPPSSDGTSVEQENQTPRKKTNSSLQINLEKDSNSKKLESKFRFDSVEEEPSNSKSKSNRKMIVQNFEAIIESCDYPRRADIARVLDLETTDSKKTNKVSIFLDNSQAGFGELNGRLGSIASGKNLPALRDNSSCNPCSLI